MQIVALTGAGISRESGLKTFRDEDGLWAGFHIEDVCTPEALARDPHRVLEFYNMRRKEVREVEPNAAHFALAELETYHHVRIITQNIDDLHERAGSTEVLHLHGEVFKVRSMENPGYVVETRDDIALGDVCPEGGQLRPHVCFFGETPYEWMQAVEWTERADIFVVIGTSLQVYPAAGLVHMARRAHKVLIDPHPPIERGEIEVIAKIATEGVPQWVRALPH